MLNVAEDTLDRLDAGPCRAVLTGDGGSVELDELELTARWCADTFTLGNACAAGFTARVTAQTLPLARGDWAELTAQTEEAELPLGRFRLTQVSREVDSDHWTLAGEDAMAAVLEEESVLEATPASAAQWLENIADRCGLTLAGAELAPEVTVTPEAGTSLRTLLGELALLCGANARIDRSGVLRLSRFTPADWTLGPERYYESELELEEGDYTLGALSVTVPGENGAADTVYSAQLEGESRGLAFRSGYFDQAAFDALWAAWQGAAFRPGSVSFLGNILLDPGDVITVADRTGTEYTLPVLEVCHRFDGGWRTTVTARAPAGESTAQPQTVSQALTGLKLDLGRFCRLYADELEAVNAEIENLQVEVLDARTIRVTAGDGTVVLLADAESGELVGTKGTIGGLTLSAKSLTATYRHDYPTFTQADVDKAGQYVVGSATLTDEELEKYDVNMDGQVTSLDRLGMQKMINGTEPSYSVYQLTIDATNPRACVKVEITEGYHAGWETKIGIGALTTRDLVATDSVRAKNILEVNGSQVTDFVVEQGTDGIWTWRKWYSGAAECWGSRTYQNQALTAGFGSLYGTVDGAITPEALPFTFAAAPAVTFQVMAASVFCWATNDNNGGSGYQTESQCPGVRLVRSSNAQSGVWATVAYQVKGRWK